MFIRICLVAICAVFSAQAQCQGPYNPSWNTPSLPYELLAQLPSNYGQDFVQPSYASEDGQATYDSEPAQPIYAQEIAQPTYEVAEPSYAREVIQPTYAREVVEPTYARQEVEPSYVREVIRSPPIIREPTVRTVNLPGPPPPEARVISNVCTCVKTIVRPQVYRRVVKIAGNTHVVTKSYAPVVEKIKYNACGLVGSEASEPCNRPAPLPLPRPLPCPRPVPRPLPCPRPVPRPLPCPRPVPRPLPCPRPVPVPVPCSLPAPPPCSRPEPTPKPFPCPYDKYYSEE